jgi:hypothetical protein
MGRGGAAACRDGAVASRLRCVGEGSVCSGLTGQGRVSGFGGAGHWAERPALLLRSGGRIHSWREQQRNRRRPKGPPQHTRNLEGKWGRGRVRVHLSVGVHRDSRHRHRAGARQQRQRPRHWPAAPPRERRSGGDQARGIRHTIKKRARLTAERRGCEAAWSAPRENFAGRFPASPTSSSHWATIRARRSRRPAPNGIDRGNHETDYVGEPKRQAGVVDRVGNWRNDGQVLPLCADCVGSGRARVACRIPLTGTGRCVVLCAVLRACDERRVIWSFQPDQAMRPGRG